MSAVSGIMGGLAAHAIGESSAEFMNPMRRQLTYWVNSAYPNLMPPVEQIIFAWRAGWLTNSAAALALKHHGVNFNFNDIANEVPAKDVISKMQQIWYRCIQAQQPQPGLIDILTLFNRGRYSDEDFFARMRRLGFQDDKMIRDLKTLANDIPGPADMSRFAVRHVFEPDLISYFGYNDEYRPAVDFWLKKLGLGYDVTQEGPERGQRPPYTWGQAYWWAHWILPSPGQGYEMVQRLRPTGGANGGPRDPSGQTFTTDDLKLLLRANDYPPFWRDKLLAISFRPIGLRQITQMRQLGVTDQNEVIEQWQDLGYSRPNAEKLAKSVEAKIWQGRYAKETTGVASNVIDAYKIGTISQRSAVVQLYRLQIQTQQDLDDYNSLSFDQRFDMASNDPGVQLKVNTVDLEVETERVKAVISALRHQFLEAHINSDKAKSKLDNLGIDPKRRDQYVAQWLAEFTPDRKELQTRVIQDYLRHGIINGQEAVLRLTSLGWADSDIPLLLAEVQRNVALDLAKQAAQAARTQAEQQRAQEQAVRAAQQQLRQEQASLLRSASKADLKRYMLKGWMPESTVRDRLAAIGMLPADIDTWVQDAFTKPVKPPQTAPNPPSGP